MARQPGPPGGPAPRRAAPRRFRGRGGRGGAGGGPGAARHGGGAAGGALRGGGAALGEPRFGFWGGEAKGVWLKNSQGVTQTAGFGTQVSTYQGKPCWNSGFFEPQPNDVLLVSCFLYRRRSALEDRQCNPLKSDRWT